MIFDDAFKEKFAAIRCYDDTEVAQVLNDLRLSTRLEFVFSQLFPNETVDTSELYRCTSIDAIQDWILTKIVPALSDRYTSINIKGLEALNPNESHIFISNHRDIAMDPMLVNLALYQAGHQTAHSAIGDNLLMSQTGTRMALLNKCFRIARSITSPKALLNALKLQAEYIRTIQAAYNANIWIAQSEGRALDNIDTTNPALIKMLTLGIAKPKQAAALNRMRIVPVTISYEWDPCDLSKAQRLINNKQHTPESKLAHDKADTLLGILGDKGNITVHFGTPVTTQSNKYPSLLDANHNALPANISSEIDREIRQNYTLYNINHVAHILVAHNYDASAAEQQFCSAMHDAFSELKRRIRWLDTAAQPSALQKQVIMNYTRPLET